jgi:hypothetical protein
MSTTSIPEGPGSVSGAPDLSAVTTFLAADRDVPISVLEAAPPATTVSP